jgi:hypothetical protein
MATVKSSREAAENRQGVQAIDEFSLGNGLRGDDGVILVTECIPSCTNMRPPGRAAETRRFLRSLSSTVGL